MLIAIQNIAYLIEEQILTLKTKKHVFFKYSQFLVIC
jgi:hypothetical protein